jgi:hypothetical protein
MNMQKIENHSSIASRIMFFLLVFAPYGISYSEARPIGGPYLSVFSLLWRFGYQEDLTVMYFDMGILYWFLSIPLSATGIFFVYMVLQYYEERVTKRAVYMTGVLSILPMTIFGIMLSVGSLGWGFFYHGPLPILMVIGLILVSRDDGRSRRLSLTDN